MSGVTRYRWCLCRWGLLPVGRYEICRHSQGRAPRSCVGPFVPCSVGYLHVGVGVCAIFAASSCRGDRINRDSLLAVRCNHQARHDSIVHTKIAQERTR